MPVAVTKGIKIMVETFYQQEYSSPLNFEYMYAYRITIHNESAHTVQLLSRHWYIQDSMQPLREVKGDGVVGQQPILYPGESYQYISGCNLRSELGKMYGCYLMQRINDGYHFKVTIPEFQLCAPQKLN